MAVDDPWRNNPFFVLGVQPEAPRKEIERTAQKLLGMIELGVASSKTYRTPLGRYPRTSEEVREAVATLRDPDARVGHELMARVEIAEEQTSVEASKLGLAIAEPLLPKLLGRAIGRG